MAMKPFILLCITLFLGTIQLFSQSVSQFPGFPDDYNVSPENKTGIRLMFYNVENLFDPENDPLKNDDSFTPEGMHHWTMARYREKITKTYKVISAVGGWEPPAIIGFCEVENRKCMYDLVNTTPLFRFNYQIIHEESGDNRGIDVALIYRTDKFRIFTHHAFQIIFPDDSVSHTRNILVAGGTVLGKDTLFVFVNHWPSKYGGAKETEEKRIFVGKQVRQICDSVMQRHPTAGIVLMGDFNDEPKEPSLTQALQAFQPSDKKINNTTLYNLMLRFNDGGTHKFQKHWSIIDQFIVNGNLMNPENSLHTTAESARIFKADFLVESDETHLGDKPFRTYIGMKYHGGFSDHLPIYMDLLQK